MCLRPSFKLHEKTQIVTHQFSRFYHYIFTSVVFFGSVFFYKTKLIFTRLATGKLARRWKSRQCNMAGALLWKEASWAHRNVRLFLSRTKMNRPFKLNLLLNSLVILCLCVNYHAEFPRISSVSFDLSDVHHCFTRGMFARQEVTSHACSSWMGGVQ